MLALRRYWPWVAMIGCFIALALLCWELPQLGLDEKILSYWATIVSGLVGGSLTLAAGLLAWSGAQRQVEKQKEAIEQQQKILDFVHLEGIKRQIRLMEDFKRRITPLIFPLRQTGKGISALMPQDAKGVQIAMFADFSDILASDDLWRLDYEVVGELRDANNEIKTFNQDNAGKIIRFPDNMDRMQRMLNAALAGKADALASKLERIESDLSNRVRALEGISRGVSGQPPSVVDESGTA